MMIYSVTIKNHGDDKATSLVIEAESSFDALKFAIKSVNLSNNKIAMKAKVVSIGK